MAPVIAKSNFTAIKVFTDGIKKQPTATRPNAMSMDFLYPMRVMKEATIKEVIAMLRSLKGSNTDAADAVAPK